MRRAADPSSEASLPLDPTSTRHTEAQVPGLPRYFAGLARNFCGQFGQQK